MGSLGGHWGALGSRRAHWGASTACLVSCCAPPFLCDAETGRVKVGGPALGGLALGTSAGRCCGFCG
eukprot:6483846-Pyramimonas_sp.AAC.1